MMERKSGMEALYQLHRVAAGKALPAATQIDSQTPLLGLAEAVATATAGRRSDFLDIDLFQFRRSPFFPGLNIGLNKAIH